MNLLIPINSDKNLCSFSDRVSWVLVSIDGGKTKDISFYENKEDIKEFIDYMIVQNSEEKLDNFFDQGTSILVAPMQKSVEDIIEAYMFCELHQLGS